MTQRVRTDPDLPGKGRTTRSKVLLCILSGAMLGFSFPPSPFGILACFGLVPLLVVLADIDRYWPALKYSYLSMLVFNFIALNWTGGYSHANDVYMMIAGAITMLVHPLFFWIPVFVSMAVKRHLGERAALVSLPAVWVAFEYTHSLSEWSFPWLTLGNSQTYDLSRIQFISVTGVEGLSFWILCLNIVAFLLVRSLASGPGPVIRRRNVFLAGSLVLVFFLPTAIGTIVLSRHPSVERITRDSNSVTVGIVQSNLDPWEKWSRSPYEAISVYERLTNRLLDSVGSERPDIVLWPETAVPVYLLVPRNAPVKDEFKGKVSRLNVSILTGLPNAVFYADSATAPRSAKRIPSTGERYDAFNAAALFQPGVDSVQWYGKMKMVPLAERVPYADFFAFLDFLRWDVGIGGWKVGRDSTIFVDRRTGVSFCTMICYESVYPEFVASFVRKGAGFIAVITIDSWWGKMSGAYQHEQFSILRAVENRRWIARCALGGISCYIDPYGRVYDKTELLTPALLSRTIERRAAITPYTRHGEWLSQLCLLAAGLLLAASAGQAFVTKHKQVQANP